MSLKPREMVKISDEDRSGSGSGFARYEQVSEFQARLKRDHAWAAVTAQPNPQQACRRRSRVGERSKSSLGGRISGNSGQHHAWQPKVWMVEDIKKLALDSELYMLGHLEPFCQVEVIPNKIRATQGIAAEVAELAILWAVAAVALTRARIDRRHKCVGVEPLNRARLRDPWERMGLI